MTEQNESRGRRAYRWVWTVASTLVAAVGCVISVMALGWVATGGSAAVAAALAFGWYCVDARRRRAPHQLGVAVTGVLAGVALAGWGAAIGGAALAIPVAVLLTMPGLTGCLRSWLSGQPFRRGLRSRFTSKRPPAPVRDVRTQRSDTTEVGATPARSAPPPEPAPQLLVHELTDAELCRAWRASYVALDRLLKTPNTVQQARWIARRQQYLDELEHRNPHGFHRWLQSGARPAGDPSRYLRPDPT